MRAKEKRTWQIGKRWITEAQIELILLEERKMVFCLPVVSCS